jgi:hypothetical protein
METVKNIRHPGHEFLVDAKYNFGDVIMSTHTPGTPMVITGVRQTEGGIVIDASAISEDAETGEKKYAIPGSQGEEHVIEVIGKMSFDEICEGLARACTSSPDKIPEWIEFNRRSFAHYSPHDS